jgi:hypothetical protein
MYINKKKILSHNPLNAEQKLLKQKLFYSARSFTFFIKQVLVSHSINPHKIAEAFKQKTFLSLSTIVFISSQDSA